MLKNEGQKNQEHVTRENLIIAQENEKRSYENYCSNHNFLINCFIVFFVSCLIIKALV